MSDHYSVIGHNNRNALVQSKVLAPFHEDITRKQTFEPANGVSPGSYTKIKLDLKHATDREIILNDIRLRFQLDFKAATGSTAKTVGNVFCVRGTDLIRELTIKINEDIVFKVDRAGELSMLWLMNNHRLGGEDENVRNAFLMNHGVIPSGASPAFYYNATDKHWYHKDTKLLADRDLVLDTITTPGLERHDGLPRLIYSDQDSATAPYKFMFDISLNQLCGPIFHRLHLRRVEFIQIELMFEPWVTREQTQNFLLFATNPGTTHPYSTAVYNNIEIRQYRTTLLNGIKGFTLPDSSMLSWLMHRFSKREITWTNMGASGSETLDIQLHDWEIRSNIVRLWWMFAPTNSASTTADNGYAPFAAPCEGYDQFGVEILWKNDKVLDLDTVYQVYRHYVLSENKRYHLSDPYIRFNRLFKKDPVTRRQDTDKKFYQWNENARSTDEIGLEDYEVPIYHVDFSMNIQHSVPGTELVGGIVNDTADYVIRLKKLKRDESVPSGMPFQHSGTQTLWVWIEYQTLVNLAGNSSQFQRGSQIVTKQLNIQN